MTSHTIDALTGSISGVWGSIRNMVAAKDRGNRRFIDWIWHIEGSVPIAPGQSNDEAFERLDPLFGEYGTIHERTNETLTFRKKGQGAQDKMSVFDGGTLRIEQSVSGRVLYYYLTSRMLLFCFLAPVMFLGFAQLATFISDRDRQSTAAAAKAETPAEAAKKKAEKEKADKKKAERQQNPIDKFLGAPAPDKPKKDKDKAKKEDEDDLISPTPAYVFAGLFAALYVVGRVLEDWLVKRLFKKRLLGL